MNRRGSFSDGNGAWYANVGIDPVSYRIHVASNTGSAFTSTSFAGFRSGITAMLTNGLSPVRSPGTIPVLEAGLGIEKVESTN